MTIDRFFSSECYGLSREEKSQLLLEELGELTQFHRSHCPKYAAVLSGYQADAIPGGPIAPLIPVNLFKEFNLSSVPTDKVFKTMTSSGTTGQRPSRIFLDAETAQLQTKALSRIMMSFLGPKRLPMLIIDSPGTIRNRRTFSARAAGILGMMTFGRDHHFALKDDDMSIDWDQINNFTEKYKGQPVLAFGFTFMVWRHLLETLRAQNRNLPFEEAILVHSGGWKKLEAVAISNAAFKAEALQYGGFSHVHNFYGMVEQTGSVFVECEQGHLHAPLFSDVIVRNALDWSECGIGQPGVIQVVSVLPRSYPGHSLLTEDRGEILGEDDCLCGRMGRYFRVFGRVPKAEVRGCSDTYVANG